MYVAKMIWLIPSKASYELTLTPFVKNVLKKVTNELVPDTIK